MDDLESCSHRSDLPTQRTICCFLARVMDGENLGNVNTLLAMYIYMCQIISFRLHVFFVRTLLSFIVNWNNNWTLCIYNVTPLCCHGHEKPGKILEMWMILLIQSKKPQLYRVKMLTDRYHHQSTVYSSHYIQTLVLYCKFSELSCILIQISII